MFQRQAIRAVCTARLPTSAPAHCQGCFHRALSRGSFSVPATSPQISKFHTTTSAQDASSGTRSTAPRSHDRGPQSSESTQTDFNTLDVLSATPAPSTAIDACMPDGFALNSGLKITGDSGVLLVNGEAFKWRPWAKPGRPEGTTGPGGKGGDNKGVASPAGSVRNAKGQFEVDDDAWGVLDLCWPKPDLLVLGTGPGIAPISPSTRARLTQLGIRVEVQDTRNAAAQFNLLATERGVGQVAAAMVPVGWNERKR